jgi:hypothetical protein
MLQREQLAELVSLQRRLIAAYQELHPKLRGNTWLLGIPPRSELQVGTERWEVTKHGAGLQFTRREPGPHLIVDMHEEADNPERLDAWRVQQFLESLGRSIAFDRCEAELRAAKDAGFLVLGTRGYRLSS